MNGGEGAQSSYIEGGDAANGGSSSRGGGGKRCSGSLPLPLAAPAADDRDDEIREQQQKRQKQRGDLPPPLPPASAAATATATAANEDTSSNDERKRVARRVSALAMATLRSKVDARVAVLAERLGFSSSTDAAADAMTTTPLSSSLQPLRPAAARGMEFAAALSDLANKDPDFSRWHARAPEVEARKAAAAAAAAAAASAAAATPVVAKGTTVSSQQQQGATAAAAPSASRLPKASEARGVAGPGGRQQQQQQQEREQQKQPKPRPSSSSLFDPEESEDWRRVRVITSASATASSKEGSGGKSGGGSGGGGGSTKPPPCVDVGGSEYSLSMLRAHIPKATFADPAPSDPAAAAENKKESKKRGRAVSTPSSGVVLGMSVRRSADGLWLPLCRGPFGRSKKRKEAEDGGGESDDSSCLDWPPARSRGARDEARREKAATAVDDDSNGANPLWGPAAPPQFAAALRAKLVFACLGGRLARGFCAKVVGQGVERAVSGGGGGGSGGGGGGTRE